MGHGGSSVLPQWEKAKRVLAVCKFLDSLWIRQKKKTQKTVVWALMLAEDGRYVINLLTNFPWKPEERKSIDAVSERAPADSVICLAVLPFLL